MRRVLASVLGLTMAAGLAFSSAAQTGAPAPPKAPAAPAAAASTAQGSIDLTPRWKANDVARYDFAFESTLDASTEDSEDGKYSQRHYQEGRLSRRVLKMDDDGVTLTIIIERLKVEIRTPQVTLAFDSAAPADKDAGNDLAPVVRHVVGRPVTVRIDKSGNVQSIEGNEDPPPETEDDLKRARVAAALLGDPVIRKLWRPLYGIEGAPAGAKIGEKWRTEDKTPNPPIGMMIMTSEYTLEGATAASASVGIEAGLQIIAAVGPSAIKPEIKSQSVKGKASWDLSAGTLASWTTEQKLAQVQERDGVRKHVDTLIRSRITRVDAAGETNAKTAGPAKADAEKK